MPFYAVKFGMFPKFFQSKVESFVEEEKKKKKGKKAQMKILQPLGTGSQCPHPPPPRPDHPPPLPRPLHPPLLLLPPLQPPPAAADVSAAAVVTTAVVYCVTAAGAVVTAAVGSAAGVSVDNVIVVGSGVYVDKPDVSVTNVVTEVAAGTPVSVPAEVATVVTMAEVCVADGSAPFSLYTLRLLMSQYVSWNADGLFWTKSWHVEALALHVESVLQTPPAQSPQKVTSNTSC